MMYLDQHLIGYSEWLEERDEQDKVSDIFSGLAFLFLASAV